MKTLSIVLILLSTQLAFATTLTCEAWHQIKGQELEEQNLELTSDSEDNFVIETKFHGFKFRVDWNKELTTLYTFIKKDGNNVLFTTARVPSENHNDSFTDIYLSNGTRLSVSCIFTKKTL